MEVIKARILQTFCKRVQGLLGTSSQQQDSVLLQPCSSIHTFGMRYPIDVAFIDKEGIVVRTCKNLDKAHVVSDARARSVLERPSSCKAWPKAGQKLSFITDDNNPRGEMIYVRF